MSDFNGSKLLLEPNSALNFHEDGINSNNELMWIDARVT